MFYWDDSECIRKRKHRRIYLENDDNYLRSLLLIYWSCNFTGDWDKDQINLIECLRIIEKFYSSHF